MAEPLKNLFSADVIDELAGHLARNSEEFDRPLFLKTALNNLNGLELMQRSEQIVDALEVAYPTDYCATVKALLRALHPDVTASISDMKMDKNGVANWAVMPLAAYVARHGLDTPEFSLSALREMTMRSSSEFAVRPFFRDHTALTLKTALQWARDDNVHVRRLASEGARPRLPWGIRLHEFMASPTHTLPILEILRDDPSEYVRRSVANHLNDMAKDHPDLVADLAVMWLKSASKNRQRLVKHACRSLVKDGHAGALAAFGFIPPRLMDCKVALDKDRVEMGDTIDISLAFRANGGSQKLMVDYVIHFMRANGKLSLKVFKWAEMSVKSGENVNVTKTHPYRKVTTRKDYPGAQKVSVQVNGVTVGEAAFELVV